LNVIVLFTDGIPDALQLDIQGDSSSTASNVIKQVTDTRYSYSSTASTTSVGASTCSPNIRLQGIIVDTPGDGSSTGQTGGLYNRASVPINTNVLLPGLVSNACGGFSGNALKVRNDIAYLPSTDEFSDVLAGFRTVSTGSNADYFPSGNPYFGKLRTDTPVSILHAAENAADSRAQTIRNDTTYNPIIYTIGLGGTSFQPIDDELLQRIANDPRSSSYNSSRPAGEYIPCTAAGLASAFQQVASQILHLAR